MDIIDQKDVELIFKHSNLFTDDENIDCIVPLIEKIQNKSILNLDVVQGTNAYQVALRSGAFKIFWYLVDNFKPDINVLKILYSTCILKKFDHELEILISRYKVLNERFIFECVAQNNLNALKLFYKYGYSMDENIFYNYTLFNCTPLFVAAYMGNFEIFSYLIQLGADYKVTNSLKFDLVGILLDRISNKSISTDKEKLKECLRYLEAIVQKEYISSQINLPIENKLVIKSL